MVNRQPDLFDSAHLSATMLAGVALQGSADMEPVLGHPGWAKLLQIVHRHAGHYDAVELGNVIWALGRAGQAPVPVLRTLLAAVAAKLDSFLPRHINQVLRALVEFPALSLSAALPETFFKAVEQQLLVALVSADRQEIISILSAFLHLGHEPSQRVMAQAGQRFLEVMDTAQPNDISRLMWAYAILEQTPSPAVVTSAAQRFEQVIQAATASHMELLLWAFSRVATLHVALHPGTALLAAAAQHLLGVLSESEPSVVADAMWGLGMLGYVPSTDFMEQTLSVMQHAMAVRPASAAASSKARRL